MEICTTSNKVSYDDGAGQSWRVESCHECYHQAAYPDDAQVISQAKRSVAYLFCLTIPSGGLQMIWVAVMGQGSPFLSDLGVPSYLISLIWLAGPVSGVFVQPFMSILSDRSNHRWGRRRPFIIVGTIFATVPAILLPWTGDIVDIIMTISRDPDDSRIFLLRSIVAGLMIWTLNIAIQPVQVCIRALVIDSCPMNQQVEASAYVSRITAVGSVLGYGSSFLDLPRALPWLGTTHYQCVFTLAALALVLTVAVCCFVIQEKEGFHFQTFRQEEDESISSITKQLFRTIRLMPDNMRTICKVQFFSWLGWFPFMFYITTYLSSIYEDNMSPSVMADTSTLGKYLLHPKSLRESTLTMVVFASTSLISIILLPMILPTHFVRTLGATTAIYLHSEVEADSNVAPDKSVATPSSESKSWSRISCPTIPGAWAATNIFTSIALLLIAVLPSSTAITIHVSLLGASWAMAQWAPLAIMSTYISSHKSLRSATFLPMGNRNRYLNSDCEMTLDSQSSLGRGISTTSIHVDFVSHDLDAGVVMSIYSISIAAPQIIAAVLCSCLFWVFGRLGLEGSIAAGFVIGLGGLANLAAAWAAMSIEK